MLNIPLENPAKLRQLAAWYRAYAERANAPWVCEGRLQTAADLERHATLLEATKSSARRRTGRLAPMGAHASNR